MMRSEVPAVCDMVSVGCQSFSLVDDEALMVCSWLRGCVGRSLEIVGSLFER